MCLLLLLVPVHVWLLGPVRSWPMRVDLARRLCLQGRLLDGRASRYLQRTNDRYVHIHSYRITCGCHFRLSSRRKKLCHDKCHAVNLATSMSCYRCCNLAVSRVAKTDLPTICLPVGESRHLAQKETNPQANSISYRAKHASQMPVADFACLGSGEHAVFTFVNFSLGQRQMWLHLTPATAGGCNSGAITHCASIAVLKQHHIHVRYVVDLCHRRMHNKAATMASVKPRLMTKTLPRQSRYDMSG